MTKLRWCRTEVSRHCRLQSRCLRFSHTKTFVHTAPLMVATLFQFRRPTLSSYRHHLLCPPSTSATPARHTGRTTSPDYPKTYRRALSTTRYALVRGRTKRNRRDSHDHTCGQRERRVASRLGVCHNELVYFTGPSALAQISFYSSQTCTSTQAKCHSTQALPFYPR